MFFVFAWNLGELKKKWGAQIFRYLRCINYVISDYSCIQALWSEPRATVENMEHVIKPMEENWDNDVEWIMFWVRLGRICEFVPWARHSFIEGLWKNHLWFILEWRGFFFFYLFTCFLWELQKFVQFPVQVRVTISSLQCGDTKVCMYA